MKVEEALRSRIVLTESIARGRSHAFWKVRYHGCDSRPRAEREAETKDWAIARGTTVVLDRSER